MLLTRGFGSAARSSSIAGNQPGLTFSSAGAASPSVNTTTPGSTSSQTASGNTDYQRVLGANEAREGALKRGKGIEANKRKETQVFDVAAFLDIADAIRKAIRHARLKLIQLGYKWDDIVDRLSTFVPSGFHVALAAGGATQDYYL